VGSPATAGASSQKEAVNPSVKAEPAKEPAKPAVAAVTEKPAEKPAAQAGGPADILNAVNAWAQAWSKKDVDAYLAFYAKDFKTPGGEPRPQWEDARRERVTAPKSIAVG